MNRSVRDSALPIESRNTLSRNPQSPGEALLDPLGEPGSAAAGAKSQELGGRLLLLIPTFLLSQDMLMDQVGKKVSITLLTADGLIAMSVGQGQTTKSLDEIAEANAGRTTLRTHLAGEAMPDRLAGHQFGVEQGFLDNAPWAVAEGKIAKKFTERTARRALAALEAAGESTLQNQLFDVSPGDGHTRTPPGET